MGYMGLGMQRWISTMKPKKFLQKRSKPDGGGIVNLSGNEIDEYFHLHNNDLKNIRERKYTEKYKQLLNKKFNTENRKNLQFTIISLFVSAIIVGAIFLYLASKFGWF